MNSSVKLLVLCMLGASVSGCSSLFGREGYFHDKSNDYLQAEAEAPIKVPADFNSRSIGDALVVPPSSGKAPSGKEEFSVLQPDQLIVRTNNSDYRIEQEGDNRWIVAQHSPAAVWGQLVKFWQDSNVPLAISEPKQGVMETDWTQLYAQGSKDSVSKTISRLTGLGREPMQDRFRVELKQGIQPNTSNIFLQYAAIPEDVEGADRNPHWDTGAHADKQVEYAMLNQMLVFLAKHDQQSSVSLMAQNLNAGDQAALEKDGNGNPILQITLPFERSWVAVESALKKADIKVTDKDREAGLFYIATNESGKPVPEKEEKGFFGSLFSSSDKESEAKANKPDTYQLRMTRLGGDEVHLSLEKDINTVAPKTLSEYVLTEIRKNLN